MPSPPDQPPPGPASDIRRDSPLVRLLPPRLRPYALLSRVDRPIGAWLLLFPCWWGIALASVDPQVWALFALTGVGAVAMRGAGCTWNDILDRDLDARVARTRGRPLPAGEATVKGALLWLAVQLAAGAAVLLSLDGFAVWVGVASLALVALYPLAKRVTFWPQLVLGLAFNWGALLGWAAVEGALGAPALLLYAGGVLWTLGYDTIYAHQDLPDDPGAGIKSSARAIPASRPWLAAFYLAAVALFGAAGAAAGLGWMFWAGLCAGACQLLWQVAGVDLGRPADCLAKFRSNRLFGWSLLAAVVAGHLS